MAREFVCPGCGAKIQLSVNPESQAVEVSLVNPPKSEDSIIDEYLDGDDGNVTDG